MVILWVLVLKVSSAYSPVSYTHLYLIEQSDQPLEWNMFDNMHSRYGPERVGILRAQITDRIGFDDVKTHHPTLTHHDSVQIDTTGYQSHSLQQFQPFAPTATDIEDRRTLIAGLGLSNDRQVNLHAQFDVFAGAAEAVFEADVEGIEKVIFLGHQPLDLFPTCLLYTSVSVCLNKIFFKISTLCPHVNHGMTSDF